MIHPGWNVPAPADQIQKDSNLFLRGGSAPQAMFCERKADLLRLLWQVWIQLLRSSLLLRGTFPASGIVILGGERAAGDVL
jgi:hypothetical protein